MMSLRILIPPLDWEWLEDDLYKTLKMKIASKIKTILKMKTILRTKTCFEDEDNLKDEDILEDEVYLEDGDNLEDRVCPCKDVHWYLCNEATIDATI